MPLLPRKGLLAIAAVVDVAMHARGQPVIGKALANRQRLPPRHVEPVLQALVRGGVLKGIRGPRGGYQLAREPRGITADEILRVIGTIEDDETYGGDAARSSLPQVLAPALAQAEVAFSEALGRISVEDLLLSAAQTMRGPR